MTINSGTAPALRGGASLIRSGLSRLRVDQRGLTTVEYAIVLCLIAAVVVGTWQKFGAGLKSRIASSTTQIDSKMDDAIEDFH